MGIISVDDEEPEIRQKFQKPVTYKKFELQPIEEEEIEAESEIQKLDRNLNEEKKQVQYKLIQLQQFVDDHFADAEKQEMKIFTGQTRVKQGVSPQLKVQNGIKSEAKTHHRPRSRRKTYFYDQLDSIKADDEEEKESTLKKSSQKDQNKSRRVQDLWDQGQGYLNKKHEVRQRKPKDKFNPQKELDQLLKETEEQLRHIYGDPDIEQLPSKLNSERR